MLHSYFREFSDAHSRIAKVNRKLKVSSDWPSLLKSIIDHKVYAILYLNNNNFALINVYLFLVSLLV